MATSRIITFAWPEVIEFGFGRAARGCDVTPREVSLKIAKIDARLKVGDQYVGRGRTTRKRKAIEKEWPSFLTGVPMVMPIMKATLWHTFEDFVASTCVCDGRHRLWKLAKEQVPEARVIVPQFQVEKFLWAFAPHLHDIALRANSQHLTLYRSPATIPGMPLGRAAGGQKRRTAVRRKVRGSTGWKWMSSTPAEDSPRRREV